MPDADELGAIATDLALYDDAIERMETEWKINQARVAEDAAFAFDKRIDKLPDVVGLQEELHGAGVVRGL